MLKESQVSKLRDILLKELICEISEGTNIKITVIHSP